MVGAAQFILATTPHPLAVSPTWSLAWTAVSVAAWLAWVVVLQASRSHQRAKTTRGLLLWSIAILFMPALPPHSGGSCPAYPSHAHSGGLRQVDVSAMQLSPHALPLVQTLLQACPGDRRSARLTIVSPCNTVSAVHAAAAGVDAATGPGSRAPRLRAKATTTPCIHRRTRVIKRSWS